MAKDSDGGNGAGDGISLLKGPHSYPVPPAEGSERQWCIGRGAEVDLRHGHASVELRQWSPWSWPPAAGNGPPTHPPGITSPGGCRQVLAHLWPALTSPCRVWGRWSRRAGEVVGGSGVKMCQSSWETYWEENRQGLHGSGGGSPSVTAALALFPQGTCMTRPSDKTLPLVYMQSVSRWQACWRLQYNVGTQLHSLQGHFPYLLDAFWGLGWTSCCCSCQHPGFSVDTVSAEKQSADTFLSVVSKGAQEMCLFFPSYLDLLCWMLLRGIPRNTSTQQMGHVDF